MALYQETPTTAPQNLAPSAPNNPNIQTSVHTPASTSTQTPNPLPEQLENAYAALNINDEGGLDLGFDDDP